jgi:hypothetical protein
MISLSSNASFNQSNKTTIRYRANCGYGIPLNDGLEAAEGYVDKMVETLEYYS